MERRDDVVTRAMASWKADLIELTAGNPLLNLKPGKEALRLAQPSPELIYEQLSRSDDSARMILARAATLAETGKIVAATDTDSVPATLRRFRQEARTFRLQQGIEVLFVTLGLLHWSTADGETYDSPILLLPVRLDRPSLLHDYSIFPASAFGDEGFFLNPVLNLKLRAERDLEIALPGDVTDRYEAAIEAARDVAAAASGWVVERKAFLGLFRFDKYAIYQDLETHGTYFAANPIVRALAGDSDARGAINDFKRRTAAELDTLEHPEDLFQVLDADSSQREAIDAINRGFSLVVQGPPGTGKSQTIANVIAESLARRRTVLFVSEKMTALDVVARRLESVGLGSYCLALHESSPHREAAILQELARAAGLGLPAHDERAPIDEEAVARRERLVAARRQLNEYGAAIGDHNTPSGQSAFDAAGELALLADADTIEFDLDPESMSRLDQVRIEQLKSTLDELAANGALVLDPESSPWKEISHSIIVFDPTDIYNLEQRFDAIRHAAATLHALQNRIRARFGLPAGDSFNDAVWLDGLLLAVNKRPKHDVPADWFNSETRERVRLTAQSHSGGDDPELVKRARLNERFGDLVFSGDHADQILTEMTVTKDWIIEPDEFSTAGRPVTPDAGTRLIAAILKAEIERLDEFVDPIAHAIGLRAPRTVEETYVIIELAEAVAAKRPPLRAWYDPRQREAASALIETARAYAEPLAGRDELLTRFRPSLIEEADNLLQRLENDEGGSRFSRLLPWRQPIDVVVEGHLHQWQDLTKDDARRELERAQAIRAAESWFAEQADALESALGHHYTGPAADWDRLPLLIDCVARSAPLIGPGGPPSQLVEFPPESRLDHEHLRRLRHLLDQTTSAIALFRARADTRLPAAVQNIEATQFEDAAVALHGIFRASRRLESPARVLVESRLAPWPNISELVAEIRDIDTHVKAMDGIRKLLGGHYHAEATDWQAVREVVTWVETVSGSFTGESGIPPGFIRAVAGPTFGVVNSDSASLSEMISNFRRARERFDRYFLETAWIRHPDVASAPLDVIEQWAKDQEARLPELEPWLRSRAAVARADLLGLRPFVEAARRRGLAPDRWKRAFARQLETLWLAWRQRSSAPLGDLGARDLVRLHDDFARLDEWQIEDAADRLIRRLDAARRELLGDPTRDAQLAELRQSAAAGSTQPLRQIVRRMPDLITALKPCLLVSPMAVARYLGESNLRFDLVIFDEASQIVPADAIGAIGRANQAVVVGDSQQLPPTSFFTASTRGGDDEQTPLSLLDAANGADFPTVWLRWHYRSRHEHLIAFSNREFYRDRLVTFPTPRQDLDPIEFVYVPDGVYDSGATRTNRVEARRLVDHLLAYARTVANPSIGVVTFSKAQMEAIQDELELSLKDEPELEALLREDDADGLFIRNLESVQGDERDVIYFSMGYGPNAHGTMARNFGPLSYAGGERRLNVAITRARERVVVFSSFLPDALRDLNSAGAQLLRRYLHYARQDPGEPRAGAQLEHQTALPVAVARALRERGLAVELNVGAGGYRIDIGIKAAEGRAPFLVGIECDGTAYEASPVARDRERLRHEVLTRLGWTIYRLWSYAWLTDRDAEIEKILRLVRAAQESATLPAPAPISPISPIDPTPPPAPAPTAPPPVDTTPPPTPTAPPIDTTPAPAPTAPPIDTTPAPAPPAPPVIPGEGRTFSGTWTDDGVWTPDGGTPSTPTPPPAPADPPPPVPAPAPRRRKPRPPADPAPEAGPKDPKTSDRTAKRKPAATPPAAASDSIADVKGITKREKELFNAAGIVTVDQLLARALDPRNRSALARELGGFDESRLTQIVQRADLMRLKGVGPKLADLLVLAGVRSCKDMRRRNPGNLHARLTEINAKEKLVRSAPTLESLTNWIAEANTIAGGE